MKKIIGLLLMVTALSNLSYATGNSASDTSTITLRAIEMAQVSVEDIDFGDYILGDPNPQNKTAAISITNGTSGKGIDITIPPTLTLTNQGEGKSAETAIIALSLDSSSVTIGEDGTAGANMTASFTTAPTTAGDYEGTATVSIAYN